MFLWRCCPCQFDSRPKHIWETAWSQAKRWHSNNYKNTLHKQILGKIVWTIVFWSSVIRIVQLWDHCSDNLSSRCRTEKSVLVSVHNIISGLREKRTPNVRSNVFHLTLQKNTKLNSHVAWTDFKSLDKTATSTQGILIIVIFSSDSTMFQCWYC